MKKISCILIISVLTFLAKAQINNLSNTPDIKPLAQTKDSLTLPETDYNFGKIPQGKPVTHIFDVINNGTDSLKINNIQTLCGCTTPQWDRQKVTAPKEHTQVIIGYNAALAGAFVKVITINYNNNETKQITIRGEVWKTPGTSAPENNELGNLKNL